VSSALSDKVRAFLTGHPVGVLATQRPDGSARQSVVYHLLEGDRVLISTQSKRAKARDVARSGRASYCVLGHEKPFPSVTVEGPARILTEGIGEPTARLFALISGQAPADPLSDEALGALDRVLLELTVDHVYGIAHFEA